MHVHERAVEQRIPFGEQGNGAAGFQMRGESGGRFLVELGERSGVSAGMIRRPGGEWVAQLLLDGIGRNQVCRDGPRVGLLVDAGVVGDDVGFADDPCRLEGDQLGIPWAQADSVEAAGRHSASEASALIADDVIADPPRRPRTVTNGTSMPWSRDNDARASLDSAAPMNPDRAADDRGGPRRTVDEHLQKVKQRGRGVADGDDRAVQQRLPQRDRGRGAGGVPLLRQLRHAWLVQEAVHLVGGGKSPRGDAGGDHACIAQDRRAGSQRGTRGRHQRGVNDQVVDQVWLPGAVDHSDGQFFGVRGNA